MHLKRKDRIRRKKIFKKIIITIIIIILIFIGIGYSTFSQNHTLFGKITIKESTIYPTITITLGDIWGSGNGTYIYPYTVTIYNNSNETINGWTIGFDIPAGTTINAQYGTVATISDNKISCTVSDQYDNSTILPDSSVSFRVFLDIPITGYQYTNVTFNGSRNGGNTEITATGLNVDPISTSVSVGATKTITAMITPTGATGTVTWASSNTAIATVSNTGVVTGVSPGTANIIASLNSLTATCNVTILSNEISNNDVTVNMTAGNPWPNGSNYITQYNLTITNKSTKIINNLQFDINLPEGSTISGIFNCTYINNGTVFTFSKNGMALQPNSSNTEIVIQIEVPQENFVAEVTNVSSS